MIITLNVTELIHYSSLHFFPYTGVDVISGLSQNFRYLTMHNKIQCHFLGLNLFTNNAYISVSGFRDKNITLWSKGI